MPMRASETTIWLDGICTVEEAEALHEAVRRMDQPVFDIGEVSSLHTSIVQLIMASGGKVRGMKDDPVLAACFRPVGAAT